MSTRGLWIERPDGSANSVAQYGQQCRYLQYGMWENGEKVNEATGLDVVAGTIGLQSEGGEIHFRTVELTRL